MNAKDQFIQFISILKRRISSLSKKLTEALAVIRTQLRTSIIRGRSFLGNHIDRLIARLVEIFPFLKKLEPPLKRCQQKFDFISSRISAFQKKIKSRINLNSLKFEVTFFITLMVGLILIIFTSVLYLILSNTLYSQMDKELQFKAQGVSQSIRSYLDVRGGELESLKYAAEKSIAEGNKPKKRWWLIGFERRWAEQLDSLNLGDTYINFVSVEGNTLFTSKNIKTDLLGLFLKQVQFPKNDQIKFKSINYEGRRIRIINIPFVYKDSPKHLLQMGLSQKPVAALLQNWLNSIFMSIPFILALTAMVGYKLSKRILNPVEKITATAKNITSEDLGARIKSKDFYVEMNDLIDAFNDMVSRLDQAFRHIEEFSSHVAHELKTPLTIIKGESEVALLERRKISEYKRVMRVGLEESERMLSIIDDLLLLTKLDYHPEVFKFKIIHFNRFFKEICEQSTLLALDKEIAVHTDIPEERFMVSADRVHLRRLFFNLINNAIQFTPQGGRIDLKVEGKDQKIRVSISDTGKGIVKNDLNKVFDKFFQSEDVHSGSGLGLSIVQAIANLHNGTVHVESPPGQGTTFQVLLPRYDRPFHQ